MYVHTVSKFNSMKTGAVSFLVFIFFMGGYETSSPNGRIDTSINMHPDSMLLIGFELKFANIEDSPLKVPSGSCDVFSYVCLVGIKDRN